MRTTARGLNGVDKTAVFGMKEVKSRVWHFGNIRKLLTLIDPLHPAIFQVRKNAIEYPFCFTHDNGIRVLERFFWKGRRVHAPHQNRDAFFAKMVCQIISTRGIEGERRDTYKIGLPVEVDLLDGFVGDMDFPTLGKEGCHRNHPQDRKDGDRLLGHQE
jgi:hypothetical protein